jgi:hypothetical protein
MKAVTTHYVTDLGVIELSDAELREAGVAGTKGAAKYPLKPLKRGMLLHDFLSYLALDEYVARWE